MKDVQVFCQYCEDVRREIGGKVSLIGVLPGSLVIPSNDGSKLSKIYAFVNIVVRPEDLQTTLTTQVLWNDDVLRESTVPEKLTKRLKADLLQDKDTKAPRTVINFIAQLTDINVGEGGRLRA